VPPPPLLFWRQVVRRRITPLYRHPALVPRNAEGLPATEVEFCDPDDSSITEGDDHVWLGNLDILIDGGWREFDVQGMLGKRPPSVMSTSVGDGLSSSAEQDMEEVHEQLNDPEDSNLENEVCQQSPLKNHHSPSPQLQTQIKALSIRANDSEVVEAAEVI